MTWSNVIIGKFQLSLKKKRTEKITTLIATRKILKLRTVRP